MTKHDIGVWMIKAGSKLVFSSDNARDNLKNAINYDSYIGGMAGTGGHIFADVKPMCEFDTQSVINVLKSGDFDSNRDSVSKPETYAKELWLWC